MLMSETRYISVIVPLKLEWEPVYALPKGVRVRPGDRVRIKFAGGEYVAAVSGTDISPTTGEDKIRCIEEVLEGRRISAEEIGFWRQVASYYMCTVGEVYKMACLPLRDAESGRKKPAARKSGKKVADGGMDSGAERGGAKAGDEKSPVAAETGGHGGADGADGDRTDGGTDGDRTDGGTDGGTGGDQLAAGTAIELTPAQRKACGEVRKAFADGKPALLHGVTGSGKTEIYSCFAREALAAGKNVLYLVPEIALSRQLEERLSAYFPGRLLCYHSGLPLPERRKVTRAVAAGGSGADKIGADNLNGCSGGNFSDKSVTDNLNAGSGKGGADNPGTDGPGVEKGLNDGGPSGGSTMPYIVLGTRSALFLPHHDLGLVIVDEEHDSSYKQDAPAPRYNGRDVALMLAAAQGCRVLLGSATPSFESLYNCACGRFREVRLSERFHGDGDTEVVVIDTGAERRKRGMVGSISRKLIALLKKTFDSGGQAMVLRARRSYATTVQCSECGAIIRCPHCNVSLNWQKSRGRLVCNHCGYSAPWSEHIPHLRPETPEENMCDGKLTAFGAGTEKIEEELAAIFPERTIARLDSDTSAKTGWQKQVLKDFADKKIDILLGTQMLTKGFDFDNLSLVAVIQADSLLGQQDFRADEKAMQLLEQFRGRCSRRGQKGVFAIQTAQAEHPVYQMLLKENAVSRRDRAQMRESAASAGGGPQMPEDTASAGNCAGTPLTGSGSQIQERVFSSGGGQQTPATAEAYRTRLLEERRAFRYPPYTRLINIILKDEKADRLDRLAETLSLTLRNAGAFPGNGVGVTPPFAPAVDKVNDEYVRIIRISLPKDKRLVANKERLGALVRGFAAERKYDGHIALDVDPI